MTGAGAASIGRARALRQNTTEAERRLWWHLRVRQRSGHHFRRQHPIGPYVADFACLKRKLIIELDGGHHARQVDEDTARTDWLMAQGFRVVRYWNNQVMQNIEGVVADIDQILAEQE